MFNTFTNGSPAAPSGHPMLRVLVADDDPASRLFLVEAMRTLGLDAEACHDGTAAIARGRERAYDLLLLDCRMPGAGAQEVLSELRGDPEAPSADSTAVATSAEMDAGERQRLLSAGFSEVLQKPCDLADLRRIVALIRPDASTLPLLDDTQGLASTGSPQIMQAMRDLLRDELVGIYQDLDASMADNDGFADRLHRLRSSCGFCGATALAARVVQMQDHLKLGHVVTPALRERFRTTLLETIEALGPSTASA
ncbi:response regulator [Dyella subtropica]|uniref:response regulator n=1 Tax=Dyella subtropica TaxID=2992127 RepID=UPI0022510D2E|nr:response regulator [Dyella subtropica]